MKFKRWYIWLLGALMGCAHPSITPVSSSIPEFYLIEDVLHVAPTNGREIWIELEPGLDTYSFWLNGKEETLQYYFDDPYHVIIYRFNKYYINQYKQ